MSGVGLGAAEILAQHAYSDYYSVCSCQVGPDVEAGDADLLSRVEHAAHQLDALKAAGYTVVCPSSALRMFVAEAICAATSAGRVFPWRL